MTKEEIQDFTLRITHANKTEMIVIIYDIILAYTKEAKENLQKEDIAAFRNSIFNLRNAFREIVDSVDTSVDLGLNLLQLYVFCQSEITRTVISRNSKHLDTISRIITKLRDSYAEIAYLDKSEAIMGNTEKVYAGLTYNPYGRSESMVDVSANRGIFA